jgi:cytochrome bd-type quinol oxidase subunit 2
MDQTASVGSVLLPACFFGLYLILEAADWGLCMAGIWAARTREERQTVLRLMRPALDGNELWFFMALFMMVTVFPEMKQGTDALWYGAASFIVAAGAVLRMAGALLPERLDRVWFFRLLAVLSLGGMFLMGMIGTVLVRPDGQILSAAGAAGGGWAVLACFQIGTLYGAVKASNPLGERCRAAFLVSSCAGVAIYLIFALLMRMDLGSEWGSAYFWMCLVATAIFFTLSFVLVRKRKTSSGLAAGYAASFFAVFIYFSAYVTMIPQIYEPDVQVLRDSMDHTPGAFLLGTALVWTAASFVWRQLRKRVVYEWKDHI